MNNFRIAFIQQDIIWNDPLTNISNLQILINNAVNKNLELIILPEMFTTGFSFAIEKDAIEANKIGVDFF